MIVKVKPSSGSQEQDNDSERTRNDSVSQENADTEKENEDQQQNGLKKRRVKFAPEDQLAKVHILDDADEVSGEQNNLIIEVPIVW